MPPENVLHECGIDGFGKGEHELRAREVADEDPGRPRHFGQEGCHLLLAAAGQQRHDGPGIPEAESRQGLRAAARAIHGVQQGVSHEVDVDPHFRVDLLFEGQDHRHSVHDLPDAMDAVSPPGPHLGADVVEDRDARAFRF